jgi:aminotransferase
MIFRGGTIHMPKLSNRTDTFSESMIRKMTRISIDNDAINLSQGFPDFNPPKKLLDRMAEVTYENHHQYEVTWGSQALREALAKKHEHFSGQKVDPDKNIVVTCGSTEAMMATMLTVCNPGDKVIVFSPFYENYSADAILSSAIPIFVPLNPPEFTFDADVLEDAFKQGPKAIIVCNPSNPSGRVFTYDELRIIAGLAKKYDTFIITDEVYEHIVYAPYKHVYMSAMEDISDRVILCNSLSKTYSITGWRIGYIIANDEVIDHAKKVHDFLTVGTAAPLQEAVVTALKFDDSYYKELLDIYTEKKNIFINGMKELGFEYTDPQGAYYVMVNVAKYGVTDDIKFCEWMAREVGVGAVPGSSFFRENINNYVRFHFAKNSNTLYEALNRLSTLDKKATAAKGQF